MSRHDRRPRSLKWGDATRCKTHSTPQTLPTPGKRRLRRRRAGSLTACGRKVFTEPKHSLLLQDGVRCVAAPVSLAVALWLSGCGESAMPQLDPAARWAFDAATIARGASLAAIGNCRACHTRHGGQAFAD